MVINQAEVEESAGEIVPSCRNTKSLSLTGKSNPVMQSSIHGFPAE
jgi:hypothetical protein